MNNFFSIKALVLFVQMHTSLIIPKWDEATLRSIMNQQTNVNTPNSIRSELSEVIPLYSKNSAMGGNIRNSFISYILKRNLYPSKNEFIIIEKLELGEQNAIIYFLVEKNSEHYDVMKFRYVREWETITKTVSSISYINSLLSQDYCYFKGSNNNYVIITNFELDKERYTSRYFVSSSLCASLSKL